MEISIHKIQVYQYRFKDLSYNKQIVRNYNKKFIKRIVVYLIVIKNTSIIYYIRYSLYLII